MVTIFAFDRSQCECGSFYFRLFVYIFDVRTCTS